MKEQNYEKNYVSYKKVLETGRVSHQLECIVNELDSCHKKLLSFLVNETDGSINVNEITWPFESLLRQLRLLSLHYKRIADFAFRQHINQIDSRVNGK